LSLEWKSEGVMDAESADDDKESKMTWQVNEEVNRDKTGEADEMNLEVEVQRVHKKSKPSTF